MSAELKPGAVHNHGIVFCDTREAYDEASTQNRLQFTFAHSVYGIWDEACSLFKHAYPFPRWRNAIAGAEVLAFNDLNCLAILSDNAALKLREPLFLDKLSSLIFSKFERESIVLDTLLFVDRANFYKEIREQPDSGGTIYSERKDKGENAPTFLRRVYADELADGSLTLSELRTIDKSLWAGLRNWANAGNHNLDDLLSRGENKGGRPRIELGFDPNTLDPNDPRDALILRGLKARETSRKGSATYYRNKKLGL